MQERIQISQELQQLLDRRLLWIPGHGVIDGDWLQRLPDGMQDLINRWPDTGQGCQVRGPGAHYGIFGWQPNPIGDLAPRIRAFDHPARHRLPGEPAPIPNIEATTRHAQIPSSVRVSAKS